MDRHGGLAMTRLAGGVLSGTDVWSRQARRVRERATRLARTRPSSRPGGTAMTKILRPSIVLPLLLSASVLAALLAFGDLKNVIAVMRTLRPGYLLAVMGVFVAYELVQGVQWHALLHALGIRVPWRMQACTFLVGQPTRILPIGNFVQNGLLLRATGTDFGLSSAATTLSVLLEVTVALIGIVIIGVGPWGWLRPLLVIGMLVFLSSAWIVYLIYKVRRIRILPPWLARQQRVRDALAVVTQFRAGALALCRPAVLVRGGALGALYLVLGGSALYLVLRGLGVDTVSWGQVLGVYFFSLACALILPVPVDVGVTEAGGISAFLAIGVGKSAAVSAVLLTRILGIGTAQVIALIAIAVLRAEVGALLGARPRRGVAGAAAA